MAHGFECPNPSAGHQLSKSSTFRDAFSKLSALGVRAFSTEGLFDETREHLWFANRVVEKHGATSPDVIAAARGDVPYRKAPRANQRLVVLLRMKKGPRVLSVWTADLRAATIISIRFD